jgi:hypothetical protein
MPGTDKAPVLRFGPGRDIDSVDLAAPEAPGQLAAVNPVGLARTFFVLSWDIGRIDHKTLDALLLKPVMNPEAGETGFID